MVLFSCLFLERGMIIKAPMGLQVSLDLMSNSCFVSQENQAFYQTSPAPLFHLPHQEQERAYSGIHCHLLGD